MRTTLGLAALALAMTAPNLANSQSYGAPPGSYQSQCRDIQVNGQFLTATCRGSGGWGASSINIASCASDIGVDAEGGLVCLGPAARGAAPVPYAAPRYADPGYRGDPRYVDPRYQGDPRYSNYGARGGGEGVTLFGGRNWRGEPVWIEGGADNLDWTGLNDRVRSIKLPRRSGPWQVCSDAGFRGRCQTISRSVPDTRSLGMGDSISSLRPLY